MTKQELIKEVAAQTGYSTEETARTIEAAMNTIHIAITRGDEIICRGFGKLYLKRRAAKQARDITRGTSITVPEHSVVAFDAAEDLAKQVRNVLPHIK